MVQTRVRKPEVNNFIHIQIDQRAADMMEEIKNGHPVRLIGNGGQNNSRIEKILYLLFWRIIGIIFYDIVLLQIRLTSILS